MYTVSEYAGSRRLSQSQIVEGISRLGTPVDTEEEIESEEDFQNQIQPILPNSAPGNMAAQQADIQALRTAIQTLTQALPRTNLALTANTQAIGNPLKRKGKVAELPSFYGGNQDPVAWIEDFTCACNANGINDV